MNFIKEILLFFKRLFNKEDTIKMIEAPPEKVPNEDRINFVDSLKINIVKKRNQVETLICVGDGLGIQGKISA